MNSYAYNESALRKYLLGELSGKDLDELERDYLAHDDVLERLLVVEDELTEQYASGALSAAERLQFERQLRAAPGNRERLKNAQALLTVAGSRNSSRLSFKRPPSEKWTSRFGFLSQRNTLAFAALILLVVCAGIAVRLWQRSAESKRTAAANELHQQPETQASLPIQPTDEPPQLPAKTEPAVTPPTAERPRLATFVLPMTVVRGQGGTTFVLKRGVETVQLQTQTAGGYKTYRAELQSADGDPLKNFSRVKPRRTGMGDVLLFSVPARLLNQTDYALKVSGVTPEGQLEDAGQFSFRILKE